MAGAKSSGGDGFPALTPSLLAPTRDALHAYSRVLGTCLKRLRPKRKHWWHASLRPSLSGLTTGVVHTGRVASGDVWRQSLELELDLRTSRLVMRTASGAATVEPLHGQSANALTDRVRAFLKAAGVSDDRLPESGADEAMTRTHPEYSSAQARLAGQVFCCVSAGMAAFRAGIREETSPIQVWPHHFDLSMLWLPGERVPSEDPADEELADKQMNFGFVLGDPAIPEPYFYVTAYPAPATLATTALPGGATWHSEGFEGALLRYATLRESVDPAGTLVTLWQTLLAAGRLHLLEGKQVERGD